MQTKMISIAKDFSTTPAGRHAKFHPASGEAFRDSILLPALRQGVVTVDLDGTAGYGSSFLEEAFGGLIRNGLAAETVRQRLKLKSSMTVYSDRIWRYIEDEAERVAA